MECLIAYMVYSSAMLLGVCVTIEKYSLPVNMFSACASQDLKTYHKRCPTVTGSSDDGFDDNNDVDVSLRSGIPPFLT
eukprot:12239918-Ditylum_brightwellii.AAC.1